MKQQSRPTFTVGPLKAAPGEKVSGYLTVPRAADGETRIPISLAHGVRAGPVLALIAGTHGSEYPPILALQRVRAQVDASALGGTLILVHVANLPSFQRRTVYYGPADWKNLNRVYPGKAAGTLSERIAHVVRTEVIEHAEYVADLHCGDANEALRSYSYWMRTGDAELDARSRALAIAFGVEWIVVDDSRPRDATASLYTANTALTCGKPAITTETGELGSSDERFVTQAERGAWNLLRHLRMVDGEPDEPPTTVWLAPTEVVRSRHDGVFTAAVKPGDEVAESAVLGTLTDYFGDPIEEVRAPFAGLVVYVVATPPVAAGEPLAMIGRPLGESPPFRREET